MANARMLRREHADYERDYTEVFGAYDKKVDEHNKNVDKYNERVKLAKKGGSDYVNEKTGERLTRDQAFKKFGHAGGFNPSPKLPAGWKTSDNRAVIAHDNAKGYYAITDKDVGGSLQLARGAGTPAIIGNWGGVDPESKKLNKQDRSYYSKGIDMGDGRVNIGGSYQDVTYVKDPKTGAFVKAELDEEGNPITSFGWGGKKLETTTRREIVGGQVYDALKAPTFTAQEPNMKRFSVTTAGERALAGEQTAAEAALKGEGVAEKINNANGQEWSPFADSDKGILQKALQKKL
jgi:hypothetical protein